MMLHGAWFGRWYADPMAPEQARRLLEYVHCATHRGHRSGHRYVTGRLQAMVAHFWLEGPDDGYYRAALRTSHRNRRSHALAEIIYGQLLLSCKLVGAFDHLDEGFALGARLMCAEDFLQVRWRHVRLRRLALDSKAAPPATLNVLLVEAAVIARLENAVVFSPVHNPCDTLG